MKNRPSLLLFMSILCLASACKKDGAFSSGSNTNTATTCLITSDSSDQFFTNGNQFMLSYDGNNHLSSVVVVSSGTTVGSVSISAQQILRKTGSLTETFNFTKSIFGGSPDSYTYTNSMDAGRSYTVALSYTGKGQVSGAQITNAGSTTPTVLTFAYDGDDDVTSVGIASGSSTTTYVSTGYDNNNSVFYNQSGSALLFYSWDYASVAYSDLFRRLSRHNIMGWKLTYPTGSTTAGYSYTYDPKNNFPTTVTQATQSIDNGTTSPLNNSYWSYSFECK